MSRFLKHEINSPQMRSVVVLILCTYFWIFLVENRQIFFLTCISTPKRGDLVAISQRCLILLNLE